MATESSLIQVDGLQELEAKLVALGKKEAPKLLRKALRKGGKIVADDAKTRIPTGGTGALAASIGMMARKGKYGNVETMFVGPRMKNPTALALANQNRSKKIAGIYYGHMVEEGSVHNTPTPFMRPALDTNANEVLRVVVTELNRSIDRVARK